MRFRGVVYATEQLHIKSGLRAQASCANTEINLLEKVLSLVS